MEMTGKDIIYVLAIIGGPLFNTAYVRGKVVTTLESLKAQVDKLEDRVQYEDVCEANFGGLKERVRNLEQGKQS